MRKVSLGSRITIYFRELTDGLCRSRLFLAYKAGPFKIRVRAYDG